MDIEVMWSELHISLCICVCGLWEIHVVRLIVKSSESKFKSSTLRVQVQVFDSKSKSQESIMSVSQHSIHHSDL